jgi:hypothetical protein
MTIFDCDKLLIACLGIFLAVSSAILLALLVWSMTWSEIVIATAFLLLTIGKLLGVFIGIIYGVNFRKIKSTKPSLSLRTTSVLIVFLVVWQLTEYYVGTIAAST